ncbi:MAG: acyltransferase family protein [Actinomycetota bacterium]
MPKTTTPPAPDAHYRRHLDGLRTVAVVLVIAFHSGIDRLSGGFIGVDVFFVLSGFLVTGILVRDLGSGRGVQWRRFYSRRVRRILPASVLTLVVTAVVYAAVASPLQQEDAFGGFRSAFLYIANWHFIQQSTDYFAADVDRNPVLHFWSLAVEEQFYLVWPFLFVGLCLATERIGRERWWMRRGVVLLAAVASAAAAVVIGDTNLSRAYYGTETRAYELLAGAGLALTPQLSRLGPRFRRIAPILAGIAFLAILGLATSVLAVSPITRGLLVTAATATLIVALENSAGGPVRVLLGSGPMVALGLISYGMYLWHWPIIVIATENRSIASLPLFAFALVGSIVLAAASYLLLEQPVRRARFLDRHRGATIALGFASSILIGLLVLPSVLSGGGAVVGADGKPLDWKAAKADIPVLPECLGRPVSECVVVRGGGKRVVLMGDSIARMWIPAFTEVAKREGWTLAIAAYNGCPWPRDLQFAGAQTVADECTARRNDWYARIVPEFGPDLVVLAQDGYDDPVGPNRFAVNGSVLTIDDPAFGRVLRQRSESSLAALRAPGRDIVLVEPVPGGPRGFDSLSCLSEGNGVAACGFTTRTEPLALEAWFRQLARTDPAVRTIDLDRAVCPGKPECSPVVDGRIVWRDENHITATFARELAPRIRAALGRPAAAG